MTSWRHCKPHHSSCLLQTHCRTTHYCSRHGHAISKSRLLYWHINFNNIWRYYHTHTSSSSQEPSPL